jgi:hypothetical protein
MHLQLAGFDGGRNRERSLNERQIHLKIRFSARWPTAPWVGELFTAISSPQHGVGSSVVAGGAADAGGLSKMAAAVGARATLARRR